MKDLVWHRPEYWNRTDELVTFFDAAVRLGITRGAISNWRKRFQETFPDVVAEGGGTVYVVTAEIYDFARARGYEIPDEGELSSTHSKIVWHRPEYKHRQSLLVSLADIAARYGVTRQHISSLRKQHPETFPPVVAEGPRRVLLVDTEVDEFMLTRAQERADKWAARHRKLKSQLRHNDARLRRTLALTASGSR